MLSESIRGFAICLNLMNFSLRERSSHHFTRELFLLFSLQFHD